MWQSIKKACTSTTKFIIKKYFGALSLLGVEAAYLGFGISTGNKLITQLPISKLAVLNQRTLFLSTSLPSALSGIGFDLWARYIDWDYQDDKCGLMFFALYLVSLFPQMFGLIFPGFDDQSPIPDDMKATLIKDNYIFGGILLALETLLFLKNVDIALGTPVGRRVGDLGERILNKLQDLYSYVRMQCYRPQYSFCLPALPTCCPSHSPDETGGILGGEVIVNYGSISNRSIGFYPQVGELSINASSINVSDRIVEISSTP